MAYSKYWFFLRFPRSKRHINFHDLITGNMHENERNKWNKVQYAAINSCLPFYPASPMTRFYPISDTNKGSNLTLLLTRHELNFFFLSSLNCCLTNIFSNWILFIILVLEIFFQDRGRNSCSLRIIYKIYLKYLGGLKI